MPKKARGGAPSTEAAASHGKLPATSNRILGLGAVGLLLACLFMSRGGSDQRVEELQLLFGTLDQDSQTMLANVPSKLRMDLMPKLQRDPSSAAARLALCNALEQTAHHKRQFFELVVTCYTRFMDCFDYFKTLPAADPRHKLPSVVYAKIAGKRIISYGEGKEERLRRAVRYLQHGLSDEGACASSSQIEALPFAADENADSCVLSYANLLLAMRLVNSTENEIESWYQKSQRVPYKPLSWPNNLDVHLQLAGIRHQSIWPLDEVPWLKELEDRWLDIRDEMDRYNAASAKATGAAWAHLPQSENIADQSGSWNSIDILSDTTAWNEDICRQHFPITCGLIRDRQQLSLDNFVWPPGLGPSIGKIRLKKPTLMANFYQAMPGANIRPHFGTHGRVIASLGLRVPKGVRLRVGSQWREWQEGKVLLFDDAFEHEVVHRGSDPRYVFTIAILHPDVFRPGRGEK